MCRPTNFFGEQVININGIDRALEICHVTFLQQKHPESCHFVPPIDSHQFFSRTCVAGPIFSETPSAKVFQSQHRSTESNISVGSFFFFSTQLTFACILLSGPFSFYPQFFIPCICVQSCPTLCDRMDCSPPGSSVHGISQARILE